MDRHRRNRRTIPTRVGSTNPTAIPAWTNADHPHAGGEHYLWSVTFANNVGPSPRGWGARFLGCLCVRRLRTIPTRVGSTAIRGHHKPEWADHPHAGGEHDLQPGCGRLVTGPSPRGWGALPMGAQYGALQRTIPTRVGSTFNDKIPLEPVADHPHAGGEHKPRREDRTAIAGPSPRGWGAQARQS